MTFLLSAVATAAISLAASPNEPQPEPVNTAAQQKKAEEKICKLVALQMGSRRKEKVCLTASEWRDYNNQR